MWRSLQPKGRHWKLETKYKPSSTIWTHKLPAREIFAQKVTSGKLLVETGNINVIDTPATQPFLCEKNTMKCLWSWIYYTSNIVYLLYTIWRKISYIVGSPPTFPSSHFISYTQVYLWNCPKNLESCNTNVMSHRISNSTHQISRIYCWWLGMRNHISWIYCHILISCVVFITDFSIEIKKFWNPKRFGG